MSRGTNLELARFRQRAKSLFYEGHPMRDIRQILADELADGILAQVPSDDTIRRWVREDRPRDIEAASLRLSRSALGQMKWAGDISVQVVLDAMAAIGTGSPHESQSVTNSDSIAKER